MLYYIKIIGKTVFNMDVNELIKKFLKQTNYDKDRNVVLVIAYGSRITRTFREDSDLDILIVTSKNGSYRQCIKIDEIPIDITIMSIEDAEQNIIESKSKGSTYFDNVLKNGIVIFDKIGIYESLKELLRYKENKKRTLDSGLFERAEYHVFQFLNENRNTNIHYFSALELLRRLYHAKYNYSNIQSSKVYDLYTNKQLAKEKYMLKLPDDKFIRDYLSALFETDNEKRKKWLIQFFKEFENICFKYEEDFFEIFKIEIKLISLYNAIKKCKNMLLNNHPSSKSLYYIIIEEIFYLYKLIYKENLNIDIDISSENVEDMIKTIERIFKILASDYDIDYDNFKVRLN